jgi:hypothetical protein
MIIMMIIIIIIIIIIINLKYISIVQLLRSAVLKVRIQDLQEDIHRLELNLKLCVKTA